MLDKKAVRLQVEDVLKNDITYRICGSCSNFIEIGGYGKCKLRQEKNLKCKFEPTYTYYNQVLIKFKKRMAKEHIQSQINSLLIRNHDNLIEFGLYPEEINDIDNSFKKEKINER